MSFKCVHISDVHWRGLTRHDEYVESFSAMFEKVRDLSPDVIFIGGDIVHSKTQGISPELIDKLSWWFTQLAALAPTHIILGNHDGLILNKHRQDAITPIINALNNDRLFLYKKSGTYPTGVDGYNWSVFSCFDEEGWDNVKPVPGEINIAVFHGGVNGSTTDIEWNIEGDVDLDFFKDYEFTFLGDIHKLQYLDNEKRVAYPGSSIQQNYGEDPGKGFLFWDIESRDKFSSTFHVIPHTKPFVTIDWTGEVRSTVETALEYPDHSRFRVRTDAPISQAEIKHLHGALKDLKKATEIVFKHDRNTEVSVITTSAGELQTQDLRNPSTQSQLMREYYSEMDISDEEWSQLDDLIAKYVSSAAKEDTPRNIKWSIKKLEFDNTFAYGKSNVINFESLSGITGLFGKNRSGKSSIPGTLMYGLFNTTDRGTISNLHIINMRKGYCLAKIHLSANGKNYVVERQTTKKTSRRGNISAVTHLNLSEVDTDGNIIVDMNGEQRRETEKTLRSIVGTSEDFLMTSMASQGEMNNFIKNKATQRKSILTKFLDLNIFDEMLNLAKEDSSDIKALLNDVSDRDWDTLVSTKSSEKRVNERKRRQIEANISKFRLHLQELKIAMATNENKDLVTQADVDKHCEAITSIENELNILNEKYDANFEAVKDLESKIKSIQSLKSQFPIDNLAERYEAQQDLERTLVDMTHAYEKEKILLKNQKKSVKLLEEVPCGDQFPTCKFIKNSHVAKRKIENQEETVKEKNGRVQSAKNSLNILKKENLQDKIEKYDGVLKKEKELQINLGNQKLTLSRVSSKRKNIEESLSDSRRELRRMKLRVSDTEAAEKISQARIEVKDLTTKINTLDAQRMSLTESIGHLDAAIKRLKEEKIKYSDLIKKWKSYDLFLSAVSKKGIPLQIMSAQLPAINSEISKILQGVVGFTVELEADPGSNAMDIYINYGDSRRIIECGSGMEKMMASLAIRVALINVSSLPKTDLLVIDEGFGALDDMNVEACGRLLDSLKRWFRNILIISHVDAVKDTVDNILAISQKEKNSMVYHE